jgi:hypothetical protein
MILPVCCGTGCGIARRFLRGVNTISRGTASHVGERSLDFMICTA